MRAQGIRGSNDLFPDLAAVHLRPETLSLLDGRGSRSMVEVRSQNDEALASQPVAYRTTEDAPDFTSRPEFPFALDTITIPRAEMADYAIRARDLGIHYIGACCGTVASHVRAMAKALGKLPAEDREWRSPTERPMSAYEYYGHNETEAPVS